MSSKSPYEIIDRPVMTEKSLLGAAPTGKSSQFTFKVRINANKREIRWAVETAYGVKVTGVNIVLTKGKIKYSRQNGTAVGKKSDVKKAIVTLAPGQQISLE
jgi:large subunit ribosomal protein L23